MSRIDDDQLDDIQAYIAASVDEETMRDAHARELNDRIFDHYGDGRWLEDVVTRRANIELMFIDP